MTAAQLPIFPLGTVLFPNGLLPLHIFEERYRRMLRESQHNDPAFVIALARPDDGDDGPALPAPIGTACRVSGVSPRPDGRSDIVVSGTFRVEIGEIDWTNGYAVGEIAPLSDIIDDGEAIARAYSTLRARFHRYLRRIERLIGESLPNLDTTGDPARGSWVIGETLTLHTWERQALLEAPTVDQRLETLDGLLGREDALLRHTGMIGSTLDYPGRNLSMN
jgi:Lon protease-like protein